MSPVEHLREDALLGPTVERVGPLEIEPTEDFFARFIQSIVRQQVSMTAAAAIEERLRAAVDFTPSAVVAADPTVLREAGLSNRKVETVQLVAEQFTDGTWTRARFEELPNDAVIEELSTVKGVGVWTAKMQLMFSLGRPDVFPVEDLGIRQGIQELAGEELTRAEMTEMAERWAPHRSLASLYIWRVVD